MYISSWCSCFWRQWNFEDRESEKTVTQKWCKKCSHSLESIFCHYEPLGMFQSKQLFFQFASSTWISIISPLVQTRHSAEADYLVDLLFDLIQPFVQRSLVRCIRSSGSQRNRIEAQPPHTQNVVQLQIDTMTHWNLQIVLHLLPTELTLSQLVLTFFDKVADPVTRLAMAFSWSSTISSTSWTSALRWSADTAEKTKFAMLCKTILWIKVILETLLFKIISPVRWIAVGVPSGRLRSKKLILTLVEWSSPLLPDNRRDSPGHTDWAKQPRPKLSKL